MSVTLTWLWEKLSWINEPVQKATHVACSQEVDLQKIPNQLHGHRH